MKLPILLTTLNSRQEQVDATKKCYNSLVSQEYLLDVTIDGGNESISLTQKWNRFIDQWRGRDYQYLMIVANDTFARPESIDYFIRFMEDNKEVGIGESKLRRAMDFETTEIAYSSKFTHDLRDTSNFVIRKGVIEANGSFDEIFPFAQNERDYIYRAKLNEILTVQTEMELFYHPVNSMTMENRGDYEATVKLYRDKWGGDWMNETFTTPFNV